MKCTIRVKHAVFGVSLLLGTISFVCLILYFLALTDI